MVEDTEMKTGKLTALTGCMLGAALLIGQGCNEQTHWVSATPGDRQGDVTLYRDVSFDDIPVPMEYELLQAESYSFQGAMFRNGVFHYQGELEWTRALEFYRTQFPAAGWALGETERGFDFRVLHFRKGPEQLIVTVRQLRGGSRAELQLDNVERNDLLLKGMLDAKR